MTAPSNANASGLVSVGHIVWWKAGGVSYYPEGEAFGVSKSCRVEPLVTAASAQAAIDRLEDYGRMAAQEAVEYRARADRLAKALEFYAEADLYTVIDRENALGHDDGSTARAALQQETQP